MLLASVLASVGAVNYPARTNGNNTFYGTNSHVGPVIMGNTNWIANGGSRVNKVFFTNGTVYATYAYFTNGLLTPATISADGLNAVSFVQAPAFIFGNTSEAAMINPAQRVVSFVDQNSDDRVTVNLMSLNASGSVTATNFVHSKWKWIDILTSGDAIASNPTGDPPVLTQYGTSNYFGYAYFYNDAADGDKSYFTLQSAHKIATTNAANPNVWVEPHIHVTATTFAAGTNATFRLDLYYGSVFGYLTNWYAKTNSVSMTNTYQHCVLSFGNLTNNAIFSGRSSVLFKGRIMRIDGGTGDIGANPVWVDSIDIHIPVTELGSTGQTGD